MKIKNLRRVFRGRIVDGAPVNELEQHVWEEMGYKRLPTGEWYEAEEGSIGPSFEFMSRYPHGHVCKACRDHFRSTKYHDSFCPSCRVIIESNKDRINAILDATSATTPEAPRDMLSEIESALKCPRCDWKANEGRIKPANIDTLREYLDDWIVAAHLHWMRHNFWNRFPIKSKFVSKKNWQEHVKSRKLFENLKNYAKNNPNIIEVIYSEAGIPLYAEQKRSKHILRFG